MFLSNQVVDRLRDVATWPDLEGSRYSGVRPLGSGGMGRVFAATDDTLGREVAIKISHAQVAGADLDARLQREAQVLARLEHPGIVPVHDVGRLGDDRIFYVMKLVRGRTLADDQGACDSESATLAVFERVADAVAFAHAHGVVHSDLKPANIMVGPFGEVLVMDWGLATFLQAPPDDHVRAGTPGFMAPEQAAGSRDAHAPASDVYALGALLFWLFRRQTPPADPAAVSLALRTHRPSMPRRLRAIILKCLALRPADRYAGAAGVVSDIARYRAGGAVEAMPETLLDRAARFGSRHLTIILLLGAYVLMRAVVAWWT
jgi:serine/threonine protein kinase